MTPISEEQASVRLRLAGPEEIRSASAGEVTLPDTLDARTHRPVPGGLFCERIFGPFNPDTPPCPPLRAGHIELSVPVVHCWFFRQKRSPLATLLDLPRERLEQVIDCRVRVVTDPGNTPLQPGRILDDEAYAAARARYGTGFDADLGGRAVQKLLANPDPITLARRLREQLHDERQRDQPCVWKVRRLLRRLRVVEALRASGGRPEWMVLECLPVLPTSMRPLTRLRNGNFLSGDLNLLYRRVLSHNRRYRRLLEINAPDPVLRDEMRRLQQAVDALFDNRLRDEPIRGDDGRPLQSLTDRIRSRFRNHRHGKRVDFSARAPFVVGPELKLHQCGLPREMAQMLYEPFLLRRLVELEYANTAEAAQAWLHNQDTVARLLPEVMADHPVLLNREKPLDRTGMQAFEPVPVEGNAIRLHPLVWRSLAAGNENGLLSVHLPLSAEAQAEATVLLLSTTQLFHPANGQPPVLPTADMVLGCYHLTATRGAPGKSGELGEGMAFGSVEEVVTAHAQRGLGVHAGIRIRLPVNRPVWVEHREGRQVRDIRQAERRWGDLVPTTVGRVLFSTILPPEMSFYDLPMTGKNLARVIADCYDLLGRRATIDVLDRITELGFREATRAGLSLGIEDLQTPANKPRLLAEAWKQVDRYQRAYDLGNFADRERFSKTVEQWVLTRDALTREALEGLQPDRQRHDSENAPPALNPLSLMVLSGARGGSTQVARLLAMRGLIANTSRRIFEFPCTSSLKEGLSIPEYFLTTLPLRGEQFHQLLEQAKRRTETRWMIRATQDVVITEHDCGTPRGIRVVPGPNEQSEELRSHVELLRGRVARRTLIDPMTDLPIVHENEIITSAQARTLAGYHDDEVILVRSPMTCHSPRGVCQLCYGKDLTTGSLVEIGTPVGLLAAQALGDTLMQGTIHGNLRRTFWPHDFPTWEQLRDHFRGRRPDRPAKLAEITGRVRIGERRGACRLIYLQPTDAGNPEGLEVEHRCRTATALPVNDGDEVRPGMPLVAGSIDLQEFLRICGTEAVQTHLLRQVQGMLHQRRMELDDRHLEVIVARMLSRVRIRNSGDTPFLPEQRLDRRAVVAMNDHIRHCVVVRSPGDSAFETGSLVLGSDYRAECEWLRSQGKVVPQVRPAEPATFDPLFLGIPQVAKLTESFLSAAMLRDAVPILTEAALAGSIDPLEGLMENAFVGRRIPAGTGFQPGTDGV